jgi:hypothetical protein
MQLRAVGKGYFRLGIAGSKSVKEVVMGWMDIVVLLGLFCIAGFIFYRAFRKKKWCPTVFGSDKENSDE